MEQPKYSATEAVEAIRKLIKATHAVSVKKADPAQLEYKGPELTNSIITATQFPIQQTLVRMERIRSNQGTSYLDTLLFKLFQLGYQAGYVEGYEGPDGFRKLFESIRESRQFTPDVENVKSGEKYKRLGVATDATNGNQGTQFVVYSNEARDLYVRQVEEFNVRFTVL